MVVRFSRIPYGVLLIFFMAFPILCSAQNRIYNGKREGSWTIKENNGDIIRCNYLNDTLHGKYVRISSISSKKDLEANYCKGVLHGPFKFYWTNGKIMSEYYYKNGIIDGIVKLYDLRGHYSSCNRYQNGLMIGLSESFYYSGKTEFQFWNRNGMRSDTTIWYDRKGKYACMVITKGRNFFPKVFHLKNLKTNAICSWDVSDMLTYPLEEYKTDTVYKRRFFSRERIWIGWKYTHKKTGEVLKVYFVSDCEKMKNSKRTRAATAGHTAINL